MREACKKCNGTGNRIMLGRVRKCGACNGTGFGDYKGKHRTEGKK